jgi:hypothetical protein
MAKAAKSGLGKWMRLLIIAFIICTFLAFLRWCYEIAQLPTS